MIARRERFLVSFKLLLLWPATEMSGVYSSGILTSSYDEKPRTMAGDFIVLGVLCTFWSTGQRDVTMLTV